MTRFVDRPWWTWLSVALVALWLAFVAMSTRSQQAYLLQAAPEFATGSRTDWRNRNGELILSGWSIAEAQFRWSVSSRPSVCVKPASRAAPPEGKGKYSLGLELAAIQDVAHKDVGVIVNGTRRPDPLRLEPEWTWYWIDVPFSAPPASICVALDLPAKAERTLRDSRTLGIGLRQVGLE